MKGIILAGGCGTRLYPMTKAISKQMLPVYDKPMVYYPLATLMQFGIQDLMIISTPHDTPVIKKLFGNGSDFGISISYKVQPSPDGIAQAFILGERFINNQPNMMILGDNILHTDTNFLLAQVIGSGVTNAYLFTCKVPDPERFGVIEFDEDNRVTFIEEKPKNPRSNWAATGLYFYPGDVAYRAKHVKPSPRGELEIVDLSRTYMNDGKLKAVQFPRNSVWIDAGTPESLMNASEFIRAAENRTGNKVACLEEIALDKKFIGTNKIEQKIDKLKSGDYADYLRRVLQEKQR